MTLMQNLSCSCVGDSLIELHGTFIVHLSASQNNPSGIICQDNPCEGQACGNGEMVTSLGIPVHVNITFARICHLMFINGVNFNSRQACVYHGSACPVDSAE